MRRPQRGRRRIVRSAARGWAGVKRNATATVALATALAALISALVAGGAR